MNYRKQIEDFLKKSGGIITAAYCREQKIPTIYLSRFVKKGILSKVDKGIYASEDGNYDELYFFQYRYRKSIYSYETSLYLLGVIDKIPQIYDVTVNNGYKFNSEKPGINIHYVKDEIFDLGVIEINTMFNNPVRVYSYERTLCDFISHKKDMDIEVYVKILRSYLNYKNKNLDVLHTIAQKMGVDKKVREIMEVLYE
jgi:predicted transcriptional regulator of viral defense system